MTPTAGSAQASPSQTLSRGIRALEILADAQHPLTIAELADAMGVHRSVAYRILRTLEDHSLLVRDDGGRVQPGPGLAVLARGVSRNLQTAALPELTQLANALTMSAFVAVWDHEECVTLVTVDPRHTRRHGGPASRLPASDQRRRPRHRDPVGLLRSRNGPPPPPGIPYRAEAAEARRRGYAASHDEVISGVSSLAVPIRVPGGRPAALAVVYIRAAQDPEEVAAALRRRARRIESPAGLTPGQAPSPVAWA